MGKVVWEDGRDRLLPSAVVTLMGALLQGQTVRCKNIVIEGSFCHTLILHLQNLKELWCYSTFIWALEVHGEDEEGGEY